MKYETPALTALTLAINAIQSGKPTPGSQDSPEFDEVIHGYEDWE